MLISAKDLLSAGGVPSREAIREQLSGNYCRCTGYQAIVDAVEAVALAARFSSPACGGGGEQSEPVGASAGWLRASQPPPPPYGRSPSPASRGRKDNK